MSPAGPDSEDEPELPDRDVPWDGSSPAVEALRAALEVAAPPGTLRLVSQRIRVHERGAPAGVHEIIDAVADVQGNLVALVLLDRIDADPELRARVDSAWAQLRADLEVDGLVGADSVEVILDADGTSQVRLALGLDVELEELTRPNPHFALHHGGWHARHASPELEALREALEPMERGFLGRLWDRLRGRG